MSGIYILTSSALDELKIIKIGMTMDLSRRWYDYYKIFLNPHYIYCYFIDESKEKILFYEKIILDKTIDFKTNLFQTEYRKCNDINYFHLLIINILESYSCNYKIEYLKIYDIPIEPLNEPFNVNLSNIKNYEMIIERENIQKKYLDKIINELNENKKCLMKAPTGSGKTNISFQVINYFLPKLCIIFTPRRILNEQTINRGKNLSKKYFYHNFSLDHTINKINEYQIIMSCYQSEESLKLFILENNLLIDLIIFDEAHCISQMSYDNFWFQTYLVQYRLFMTATPYYEQENSPIYGKCINEIKIYELILKNILCHIHPIFKKLENKKTEYFDLSNLIVKSMNEYHKKKGIIFVNKQENAFEIFNLLKDKINCYIYISKNIETLNENQQNIKTFENDPNSAVIITCKKIDYGYDNIFIDFICFADPKQGYVEIRQICGRGLRNDLIRYPDKVLHILIPIYLDDFEKKYKRLKEFLDYIISECGDEFIFSTENQGYITKSNLNVENYLGDLISPEIYDDYCTENGMTGFMNKLKANNVTDEKTYNEFIKQEKLNIPLGEIKKKYPKFCFRDLQKNPLDYYFDKNECLTKINEIKKKYKIDKTELTTKYFLTKIRSIDKKIPTIDFDLYYLD